MNTAAVNVLAVGWMDTGQNLGEDLYGLIFTIAIPVLCGLFVLFVGLKTRAPGPTILAAVFAAILWGLTANMDVLQQKTTDDITQYDTQDGAGIGGDL